VFEKRLIAKFLQETGKCPITAVNMSENDLIAIQGNP
jgi:hypothetical protein